MQQENQHRGSAHQLPCVGHFGKHQRVFLLQHYGTNQQFLGLEVQNLKNIIECENECPYNQCLIIQ